MFAGLSIQLLGTVRGGRYTPYPLQTCSYFTADSIAIGSRPWDLPALVLPDSTVSPKHALIVQEGQRWVVQDLASDNGIRSLPTVPETDVQIDAGQQAFRFEFRDELCCCFGAVVLRLKAIS